MTSLVRKRELDQRLVDVTSITAEIDFSSFARSSRSAYASFGAFKCKFFNSQVPSEEEFTTHLDKFENVFLIGENSGLSDNHTHGCVLKEDVELDDGSRKNVYFILISAKVQSPLVRCFTIAHELGHVLLHGRLLESGMAQPRRSVPWFQPQYRFRALMEIQANVVAMYSLVPSELVSIVQSVVGEEGRPIRLLKFAIGRIYKSFVDDGFVRERLYLESVINDCEKQNQESLEIEFRHLFTHRRSWVMNGLPVCTHDSEKEYICPSSNGRLSRKKRKLLVRLRQSSLFPGQ